MKVEFRSKAKPKKKTLDDVEVGQCFAFKGAYGDDPCMVLGMENGDKYYFVFSCHSLVAVNSSRLSSLEVTIFDDVKVLVYES